MKFTTQNKQAVAEGFDKKTLPLIKAIPAVKLIGNRARFDLTDANVKYVYATFADADLTGFPEPAIQVPTIRNPFEFKTKPFKHQQDWFDTTCDATSYGIFWEMGLGKTKLALDTASYLYSKGDIDTLLVITLNGVHLNWVTKEIPTHLSDGCNAHTVAWDSSKVSGGTKYFMKELDKLYNHDGLTILAVNVEAFSRGPALAFCQRLIKEREVLCVIDESHAIKEPKAARTKAILKLRRDCKYRRVMTGTPVANSPLDVFTQMFFLDPEMLGYKSYYAFRARFAILEPIRQMGGGILKHHGRVVETIVGYQDVDKLQELLEPHSSRLTKAECLDLPDKIYVRHPFVISDEQRRMYKQLVDDTVTELRGERISTQMALTRMMRLHQIVCGFTVVDDSDEPTPISEASNPRIKALMSVVESVQGKAIIWATYRFSLREIVDALKTEYGAQSVVGYSGATPADMRPKVVDRFQNDPTCRFFVGQPKAGGTGITLTAATDVIYYSNDYSLNIRQQSEDRAHRIGQNCAVTYTDLEAANTIDADIITALNDKFNIAAQITGDKLVEWLS